MWQNIFCASEISDICVVVSLISLEQKIFCRKLSADAVITRRMVLDVSVDRCYDEIVVNILFWRFLGDISNIPTIFTIE